MSLRLSVCQVNLQKSRLGSQLFQSKLQNDSFIGCVTEPYTVANKVVFRPQGYRVIPEGTLDEVPRAALYIPREVQMTELGHLCVADCAVVQVKWENQDIVLVSAYLDIQLEVIQEWMTNIIRHVVRHNMKLVLTMDSNAHSSLYSLAQSNARGRHLEDFILRNNLQVENRGNIPTFQSLRAQSVIDVTLTSGVNVWNWHVDESFNGSDHNSIFFDIELDLVAPREIRPWDKADWRKFTDSLDKVRDIPRRITCKKVDKMVDKLYKDIDIALDSACPKFKVTRKRKKAEWYTDKIALLHKKVKKQYQKALNAGTQEEEDKYEILRKKFRRRCRRAKTIAWRTFVVDTPNQNKMAILSRIALHTDKRSLNVLYNSTGDVTEPGEETIRRLAEVHFPQATDFQQFAGHNSNFAEESEVIQNKFDYVTEKLVRKSLLKFKPDKAPGPDQIKPVVFKYFPPSVIKYLTFIYKACLHLRYTPRKWQESSVVFIPKAGKKDLREAKAHRPIVLSNFMLKALERLITWRMDTHLKYYPIHPMQHGFQVGKGTEAALSSTCDYIEKFVLKRKYCLGLFLDITSAYDSMNIEHIRSSLYLHGGEEELVEWYFNYLSHRVLHIPLHGDRLSYVCSQGFPQGGVASAKFWILAFNPAIEIINRQFTLGNGYADDLSVVFGGTDPDELVPRMQRVLDELVLWGESCNLNFNPEKTVMVGFTRCTAKSFSVPLKIKGEDLKFVDSVKYLGLRLDKKMTWRPHILEKIVVCKQYLMKMANIAHTTWGPKPYLMRWVFRCIVRPKITYGALLWSHVASKKGIKKKLRRLNRMGMNTYATVHRSTPSQGYEIMTDTIPLHLYARKVAVCAYVRLQNVLTLEWEGFSRRNPHFKAHLLCMKEGTEEYGINEVMQNMDNCEIDRPPVSFIIRNESFGNREAYKDFDSRLQIFTDGSKIRGRVGAAFVVYLDGDKIEERQFRLADTSSVYQAEVYAISKAASWLVTNDREEEVTFFSDSQAALLSLGSDMISSRMVLNAVRMLDLVKGDTNLV